MSEFNDILDNPFFVLGASSRDTRQRILQLADEKALELDPERCDRARTALVTPQNRLRAELSWLPGVSPRRCLQVLETLAVNPDAIPAQDGLPPLAHANLKASAIARLRDRQTPELMAGRILDLADTDARIDLDATLSDINEDRTVAGVTPVRSKDLLSEELEARRREFRDAIKIALDRMESQHLVDTLALIVQLSTCDGAEPAPRLVNELVEMFETSASGFLEQGVADIEAEIGRIKAAVAANPGNASARISQLEQMTRRWDRIASPIQLNARSRGMRHGLSHRLAMTIRDLGVDLHNEHSQTDLAARLTQLVAECFSESEEVAERVNEDNAVLADLLAARDEEKRDNDAWARSITYEVDLGMIARNRLAISPQGVSWKGLTYPLETITRIRWGAVATSTNGVPTGTYYTIAFGDRTRESIVQPRRGAVFDEFVDRLWRAVGVRILVELLKTLRSGASVGFGSLTVSDAGVTLQRKRFLASSEPVFRTWDRVNMWSGNGVLTLAARDDRKAAGDISFKDTANTHILHRAISMAFDKGVNRLSDILS